MRALFDRLPDIVKKALIFIPIRFSGLATQLLTSILIARILGVADFGAYSYAMTIVTLFVAFCTLGLSAISVREFAAFYTRGDSGRLRGYITVMLATMVLTALILGTGLYFGEVSGRMALAPGWALVLAVILTQALTNMLSELLSGMQRINTAQWISTLPRAFSYMIAIYVLYLFGFDFTPRTLFILYAVLTLPMILSMLRIAYRDLRARFERFDKPVFETRIWLFSSLPIALQLFSQNLSSQIDIIMLANMMTDYEVGLYKAAFRAASLGTLGALIAVSVLRPMLARAAAQDNQPEAQRLLAMTAGMSALFGLPLWGIIGFWGESILAIFSQEFTAGTATLRYLLIGQFVNIVTGAGGVILMIYRYERDILYLQFLAIVMNIVLNYILISWLGLNGAAIATTISMTVINIIMTVLAWRRVGLDPTPLATLKLGRQWLARRAAR
ncbi:oligosaccharide flippase family protein [Paracoccaceae bacterium GXU_MW_L88]